MNESMIIIFGNHEKVDTTKQSFRTTWLCKNIEFLDSFWFWISLINSNHRYIYVATYTHSYFILSRLQCFFLHCMINILSQMKTCQLISSSEHAFFFIRFFHLSARFLSFLIVECPGSFHAVSEFYCYFLLIFCGYLV